MTRARAARGLSALLVGVVLACAGCTGDATSPPEQPPPEVAPFILDSDRHGMVVAIPDQGLVVGYAADGQRVWQDRMLLQYRSVVCTDACPNVVGSGGFGSASNLGPRPRWRVGSAVRQGAEPMLVLAATSTTDLVAATRITADSSQLMVLGSRGPRTVEATGGDPRFVGGPGDEGIVLTRGNASVPGAQFSVRRTADGWHVGPPQPASRTGAGCSTRSAGLSGLLNEGGVLVRTKLGTVELAVPNAAWCMLAHGHFVVGTYPMGQNSETTVRGFHSTGVESYVKRYRGLVPVDMTDSGALMLVADGRLLLVGADGTETAQPTDGPVVDARYLSTGQAAVLAPDAVVSVTALR